MFLGVSRSPKTRSSHSETAGFLFLNVSGGALTLRCFVSMPGSFALGCKAKASGCKISQGQG